MNKTEALDILQKVIKCVRMDAEGEACEEICNKECPYWCETTDIFNALQFTIEYLENN